MLVVALLLIATGPWMPVLCSAAGHIAVENPFSLCCGGASRFSVESQPDPLPFSLSSASGCRDCTDIPLVSVWRPAPQKTVSLKAAPASVPLGLELPSEFSADFVLNRNVSEPSSVLESRLSPLRC